MKDEPGLASMVYGTLLSHDTFAASLSYHISRKLVDDNLRGMTLREIVTQAYDSLPTIGLAPF